MPEEFKKQWVEALRSGKFSQGRYGLCVYDDDDLKKHTYCCLGVACVISEIPLVPEFDFGIELSYPSCLPPEQRRKLPEFFDEMNPLIEDLVIMNDGGDDFETIATHIEENL